MILNTMRFALIFTALFAPIVQSQVLALREIEAPDWDRGGEDDLFGYALAKDGASLIVGIPGAPTTSAPGSGMVEVFSPSPSGWMLTQRLLPTQNPDDEKFGVALTQAGDDLAVGSWDAGFGAGQVPGSVHMYRRVAGLWQSPQRLIAPEVDSGDAFGSIVALSGDWLAITAPAYDDNTGIRGAVFLYRRNGSSWTFAQRIEGSDDTRAGGFACSMAMAGDRLYVGDCEGDSAKADTGAVLWYRLDANGATLGGTIAVADVEPGDNYGYLIAATTTHVMIAASLGDPESQNQRRVYLFSREGDVYAQQRRQPLPSFATTLQLSSDRALIAGPVCVSATTPNRNISCVRRFDRSASIWTESAPYLQQPEVGFEGFGLSIAADANAIHVGNPFRDVAAGPASGAVSSFDVAAPGALPQRLELPPGYWRFAFNARVDGNFMVATDPFLAAPDDFSEGTAWFFTLFGAGPQLLTKIDTPEPFTYERFARDVGIAGDRVVLSANRRVPGGSTVVLRTYQRSGSSIAFIDEFNIFTLPELEGVVMQTTFQISGDRVALWGFRPTVRGQAPRIAVLRRSGNTWVLEALLQPPAQEEEVAINFSRMVMEGDRIALLRGEAGAAPAEPRAWAVFIYRRTGTQWNLESTLRPHPNDPPATVLQDVAIDGDELAVSTGDTLQNTLRSRVHTFRFDGANWIQTQRIEEPAGVSSFGRQLAIENGALVVESFPVSAIAENFVTPLRLYRRNGNDWGYSGSFLPELRPPGQGRLLEYGNPQLQGGRLFAGARREGPSVTLHTHGVLFEFNASDPVFVDSFE